MGLGLWWLGHWSVGQDEFPTTARRSSTIDNGFAGRTEHDNEAYVLVPREAAWLGLGLAYDLAGLACAGQLHGAHARRHRDAAADPKRA